MIQKLENKNKEVVNPEVVDAAHIYHKESLKLLLGKAVGILMMITMELIVYGGSTVYMSNR